jgi:2-polyprenyl-6-methoxyphenol hydroxylase-like FAD-dependent oxidoreductase
VRVIVCGAGIAGLAAANRLAALGHDVIVVERTPSPRTQGYMIDFFGPGYDAIEAMGLLPALQLVGRRVALHLLRLSLLNRLAPTAVTGKPITLIQTLHPNGR